MAEYRICLFGHESEPATSCFIDADSDDEARNIGRELLTDTAFTQIQVWRQDRLILYTAKSTPGDPSLNLAE
jgi:hypothetical protein